MHFRAYCQVERDAPTSVTTLLLYIATRQSYDADATEMALTVLASSGPRLTLAIERSSIKETKPVHQVIFAWHSRSRDRYCSLTLAESGEST